MAKKNYVVKRSGTYGKRGDVVEHDFGKDGMSDRQKTMLDEFKKPVVKSTDVEVVKALEVKNKKLEAKVVELEAKVVDLEAKVVDLTPEPGKPKTEDKPK